MATKTKGTKRAAAKQAAAADLEQSAPILTPEQAVAQTAKTAAEHLGQRATARTTARAVLAENHGEAAAPDEDDRLFQEVPALADRDGRQANPVVKDNGPLNPIKTDESQADETAYRKAAETTLERDARALRPALPDRLRFWLMTKDDCYELRRRGRDWSVTKYSDGTVYTLGRDHVGRLGCSCPGGAQYGPACAGGRGCKHARMIRAVAGLLEENDGGDDNPPAGASAALRMAKTIVTGRDSEKAAA